MNLVVAGSRESVVMVEGGGKEIPEEDLLEAIFFGHQALQPILGIQEEIKQKKLALENERRQVLPLLLLIHLRRTGNPGKEGRLYDTKVIPGKSI